MTKPQTKTGLSGRCFIVLNERGRTQYQGLVHCIVPSHPTDFVLIQYFEAMMGQLNTMALIPIADLVGYILFEDDAHLRDYMEHFQCSRDERLDAAEVRRERGL
jgi:hypothetical protein